MVLLSGRPLCEEGRLKKEINCYDLLDSLDIAYDRIDHEAADNMEACREIDRVLCATICKNLFLCNRQKTDFYLLMIRSDKQFKTKDISSQIGSSRLSFAEPEYLSAYLDLTPGSVSVLGLMNDKNKSVKLLIDKDIKKKDLSAKAGVSPATITKMGKNGHVTTEVLVKICTALECQVEDIMEVIPDKAI